MEEQISTFLKYLVAEFNYSENTIAAYKNDLRQFYGYIANLGVNQWSELSEAMVRDYVEKMHNQNGQLYTPSSIARKVAAIKSFFHYLLANQWLEQDPTETISSPKVQKRLPQPLSTKDITDLLNAPRTEKISPKSLRDIALLNLLYTTGMRVTEAVSLSLADLDLENNILTCSGKDGQRRNLPIEPETHNVLTNYLEYGRGELVKNGNELALFINHRGEQLTRQGLWLIIKAYARQANLSGEVTPHTLRHSFAAHKLENGTDLQKVQKLLGHANISTTHIYVQL